MARPPNILWIVTTQWRARAGGFAGDPNAWTPALDRLAGSAVNYTEAVTPHPFGPFARAALLTGIPSPANGVRGYYDPLPRGTKTIAHDLQARGYATAFFGKWHLAQRDPSSPLVGEAHARTIVPPEERGGFECWEGFESGFLLNDPWLHGSRLREPVQVPGYQSDVLSDRAVEWTRVALGGGRPWFALVSFEPPHPPYDAPAGGIPPRDPAGLVLPTNVPRGGAVEKRARRELAGYYAHITATDQAIGRLLGALEPTNTVIVFTSVHGDMHGAHGLFRKGWPHEESIRVPLLIRRPAKPGRAGRSDELISLVDLRPLTLGWADGHGRSTARPSAQAISMPSIVRLPDQCDRRWSGLRTRRRKLVVAMPPGVESGAFEPWLFFDLENDPAEERNLVGDPACRQELVALRNDPVLRTPPQT